jgi:hypothetical protein
MMMLQVCLIFKGYDDNDDDNNVIKDDDDDI